MFEAVLVALADHGLTPSAIAARLTLTGAPESVQGALAAGLLGGGSRFLGTTEDCGRMLADALATATVRSPRTTRPTTRSPTAGRDRGPRRRAACCPASGTRSTRSRTRARRCSSRLAAESGVYGAHLRLFEAIGRVHPAILGRTLPLNGAGVCGAALADLGFPVETLRGFALLARTAGLLGHIAEEQRRPDRGRRL